MKKFTAIVSAVAATLFLFAGSVSVFRSLVEVSTPAHAQFVDQRTWGGTAGGSANAQTLTIANYTSYTAGVPIRGLAVAGNTAATTLNVSSLGARNFYRLTEDEVIPMVGGELVLGAPFEAIYDGAKFVLLGKQVPIGTVLSYAGTAVPPGYVFAGAQNVSRSAPYDALFRKTTLRQTGTTTSGQPQVTGLADTSAMAIGMPVCGTGIATNSVINSVDSGTQVTLSLNATGSASVTVTVAPYGCGDGSTTFGVIDARGRTPYGRDDMITAASRLTATFGVSGKTLGAGGGSQSHTNTLGEMVAHTHGITDPGHSHSYERDSGSSAAGGGLYGGIQAIPQTGTSTTGITVNSAGSTNAYAILNPLVVVNKIVKY